MENSIKLFKTQVQKGLLSCPILYINHYHYRLIDDVLQSIIDDGVVGLSSDSILEYDSGRQVFVDFKTKTPDEILNKSSEKTFLSVLGKITDSTFCTKAIEMPKAIHVVKENNALADQRLQQKRVIIWKSLDSRQTDSGMILSFDYKEISLLESFAAKYEAGEFEKQTTVIIISSAPVTSLPDSIRKIVTVVEMQPPTTEEIREYINTCGEFQDNFSVEELVRTLQGLQMYDVEQTLRTVLTLTNGQINRKAIRLALEEKKRIVKKSGIIEVIDTDVSFADIGGLKRLREDLSIKGKIYKNLGEAEKYNIPIPKGILIIGMPGCGKSMIAQATANEFGVSLLRLDVSRLMGKYVGESEENLRLALATAEAAHPCVLWIDEIEKAFAGTNNASGDNDMLVMRMMGHFLTWMQERKSPIYIVATANDVMRPEFMRKGRFDEVYFVNFPEKEERAEILRKKINQRYLSRQQDCIFDFSELGDCTKVVESMKGEYGGFSGSEIECTLNMVVEEKFSQYLDEKDKSSNPNHRPGKTLITHTDFDKAINRIKDSVMANQKSGNRGEMTAIERINDMQKTYKFVNANK